MNRTLVERFPALRSLDTAIRRRRIPVVRQLNGVECGLACLGMVLGYFGRSVSLEELREVIGVSRSGATAIALLDGARHHGLRGRAVRMGPEDGVVVLLRGKKNDTWTPAPAGDGPVPSYREDPVPSSPSTSGKTLSDAEFAAGDATPEDSDLGEQPSQMARGDEDDETRRDVQGPGIDGDRA